MLRSILPLLLVALTLASSCRPEARKQRIVFLFCDVTNSLNPSESVTVAAMAARVLNSLPPGTAYRIFPIQAATERLTPLNESESVIRPKEEDENLQAAIEQRRQEELAGKLSALYQRTNRNQNDNRTCILNALGFAANQLKDYPVEKNYERDLVIISDMLEECNDTPFGRTVDIRKLDITAELNLAKSFPEGVDFSGVTINVITPATEESYVRYEPGTRPPMAALREFWGTIFSRCNVSPEHQQSPEKYFWSNGLLPRRFDSVKKRV